MSPADEARETAAGRGRFVTLEGGEGSGKSTVARALARRLRAAGLPVCLTREPEGTPLGRFLWRAFRLRSPLPAPDPLAELLLFEAARAQHVREVVRPALEAGQTVLCERFTDSTLAYQGYGRGLELELVRRLNALAAGGLVPDLTLLLDVPPEVGLARKARQRAAADRIGQEGSEFHRRVREGYLALALEEPARILVVDATRPLPEVLALLWERLRQLHHGIPP